MLLHLKLTDSVVLMHEHLSSVSLIVLLVAIKELVVVVSLLFCTRMHACSCLVLGCLRVELDGVLEVHSHCEIRLLIEALQVLRSLINSVHVLRVVLAGHGWILINMRCIKGT